MVKAASTRYGRRSDLIRNIGGLAMQPEFILCG
jgi:hypothetical protein